jgi:GT2 family glycosyltransferase
MSLRGDPPVGVVILNWKRAADTIRCVESVLESDYPAAVPIVVDNASADESVERIRAAHPAVEILRSETNRGYAGGNNLGIRRALELGAEHVLVLNNDTRLAPDCIGRLVRRLEAEPRAAQVGPKVLDVTLGSIGSVGGRIHWEAAEPRQIGHAEPDRGQHDRVAEVDFVPGTAVLVRSAAIRQVGLLPEEYFLYFEDVAWSLRFQAQGWKTLVDPGAVVEHWESSSTGRSSPLKTYYLVRNNLAFLRDWAPPGRRVASALGYRIKLAKLLAKFALQGAFPHLRALFLGYVDHRRGRMGRAAHAIS